jgi:hypothetical protein
MTKLGIDKWYGMLQESEPIHINGLVILSILMYPIL